MEIVSSTKENIALINYININLGKPSILKYVNKYQTAEEVSNHFIEEIGTNSKLYSKFKKFEGSEKNGKKWRFMRFNRR